MTVAAHVSAQSAGLPGGTAGSPACPCQPPSQRHSIAAEAGAAAPTPGYLRALSTDLQVQQPLQHLKENRGVSRHPEGLSHTPRILQATPSNSGIWHHFPGCFSKQKGGERSALLLSLAGRLIAGDEEKHLHGISSIPVTSGEYLHKGKRSWIHASRRGNHWMIFYFRWPKTVPVGLMTDFPWVGTRTSRWGEVFCRSSEKDQRLMPEGRKRLCQISRALSPWPGGVVPSRPCCSPGYSRKWLKQHVAGKSPVSAALASCSSKSTGASATTTPKLCQTETLQ